MTSNSTPSPLSPKLPLRHGLAASQVVLHQDCPTADALCKRLAQQLPYLSSEQWHDRLYKREIFLPTGHALAPEQALKAGQRLFYYRHVDHESLPTSALTCALTPNLTPTSTILHQDEHLLVADKAHGIPVTPGGQYVYNTLLVQLRQQTGLADLCPIHRIDRETAGLVLFSTQRQDRNAYQALFRNGQIQKTHHAIAAQTPSPTQTTDRTEVCNPNQITVPLQTTVRQSRLIPDPHAFFRMIETDGPANSETRIRRLLTQAPWALYELQPITGKRHQLRVHMNALGLPIHGDSFYPSVNDANKEPLKLLAKHLQFTDPVTGEPRQFESQQTLTWPA